MKISTKTENGTLKLIIDGQSNELKTDKKPFITIDKSILDLLKISESDVIITGFFFVNKLKK